MIDEFFFPSNTFGDVKMFYCSGAASQLAGMGQAKRLQYDLNVLCWRWWRWWRLALQRFQVRPVVAVAVAALAALRD